MSDEISTETLDALPEGAIILSHPPMCWVKVGEDTRHWGGDWRSPYKVPGAKGEFRDAEAVSRMATRVLYDPSNDPTYKATR